MKIVILSEILHSQNYPVGEIMRDLIIIINANGMNLNDK
jgi:hypothetical protein